MPSATGGWCFSPLTLTQNLAKFKPDMDIPSMDGDVWERGTPTINGQNWKIMKFDEVKGAYKGKETMWVVTKESQGTIHSHPIGEQEAQRLMK